MCVKLRERERERTQQDENSSERIEKYKLLVWKKTIYSGDLNNGYLNYGAILITGIVLTIQIADNFVHFTDHRLNNGLFCLLFRCVLQPLNEPVISKTQTS